MTGPFIVKPQLILSWLNAKGYGGTVYDALMRYFQSKSNNKNGSLEDMVSDTLGFCSPNTTLQDKLTEFFTSITGVSGRYDAEKSFFSNTSLDFYGNILIVQQYRKSTLANAQRIRLGEQARNYIIVRNMETSNVVQIGFTTNANSNANPPGSFTDINPLQEWYETGSTNQVYFRPKVDGQSCTIELEVSIRKS